MAYNVDIKLENVKRELRSIIVDLENLAQRVKYSSEDIGEDICCNKIRAVAQSYRIALRELDKVSLPKNGW